VILHVAIIIGAAPIRCSGILVMMLIVPIAAKIAVDLGLPIAAPDKFKVE